MTEDDATLIARSRADPEVFGDLFDRHFATIHRYVTSRLGVPSGDDVAAEVFVEAFRCRERYDGARPDARPWLYGIASNLVGRHRRTELRRLRAIARLAAVRPPVLTADPDGRLDADRAFPALATALAKLSAADRDTLLLFAWAQLGYEEIAEALDVPVGTVRSRLHRARARVRAEVGAGDPSSAFHQTTIEGSTG